MLLVQVIQVLQVILVGILETCCSCEQAAIVEVATRKEMMDLRSQMLKISADLPNPTPEAPPVFGEIIAHIGSLIFTAGLIAAALGAVGLFFTRHRERTLFKMFAGMSAVGLVVGLIGGLVYLVGGM